MAADTAAKLAELRRRYALSDAADDQLRELVAQVLSDPLAPTSLRDAHKVADDHIADSLVALELPVLSEPERAVDLGSGAGFPGLVLAIARPASTFALVEATGRKCEFIERTAARCGVGNVETIHARAEAWPAGIGRFELAVARALGPLAVVLEYAAPLLKLGGCAVVWRGRREPQAEAQADRAATELGLKIEEVRRVIPYPGAHHRHLFIARKTADTPPGLPRRPGMASKRPLGAGKSRSSDRARR